MSEHYRALAYGVAADAHRKQTRKLFADNRQPQPYIEHPIAVAEAVANIPALVPIALMHDVLEDNPEEYPESRLRAMFPDWIVDRVVALSRIPGEEYDIFILGTMQDEGTRLVKVADIRDNLKDLKSGSLRDKYRLALRVMGEQP